VTLTLELPVLPAASRTVAVTVWLPLDKPVVVHGIETGPRAEVVWLPTIAPSTLSVKALDDPLLPSTHITTQALPPTVAPPVGWVTATCSVPLAAGGGGADAEAAGAAVPPALLTVTLRLTLPVWPAASRTLAVSTWLPLATLAVFHGIDTGPVDEVVDVATACPPTLSVYTFDPAPAPLTQTTAQFVPLTAAPLLGAVSATVRPPVAGGGGDGAGAVFETVTARVTLAVRPAESVTVALSVWLPLPTPVVFQVYEAAVATCTPSTASR
jgi:hypothetical protein